MRPVVLLGCLAGCSASGTSLVIELSIRSGDPMPGALTVSVFGDAGPLALAQPVASPSLPGRLLVRALPDLDETVRVAIAGASQPRTLAGARVPIVAHAQATASMVLSADTPDSDGDGIPDAIDDCPSIADPRQDHPCSDDAGVLLDVALVDLSSTDLATGPRCGPNVASRCPGSGLLFCDGFEGAMVDPTLWDGIDLVNGMIGVDGTRACRGHQSLSARLDLMGDVGNYGQADVHERRTFPSQPIYLRFYVWFPSTVPAVGVQLGQISQDATPWGGITFGVDPGRAFYFGPYTITSGGSTGSNSIHVPVDQWFCVEWMVSNGAATGTAGESRLWLNGAELTSMRLTPLSANPQFGLLELGSDTSDGPAPPFGVWLDEVALDTQPIGCDR